MDNIMASLQRIENAFERIHDESLIYTLLLSEIYERYKVCKKKNIPKELKKILENIPNGIENIHSLCSSNSKEYLKIRRKIGLVLEELNEERGEESE